MNANQYPHIVIENQPKIPIPEKEANQKKTKNEKKINEDLPQKQEKNIPTIKNQNNENEEVKTETKRRKRRTKDKSKPTEKNEHEFLKQKNEKEDKNQTKQKKYQEPKPAEKNENESFHGFLRHQLKKKQWFVMEEMCSCSEELLAQLALVFFRAKKEFRNFAIYIVEKYDILNKNVTIKEELQKIMLKKEKTINSAIIFNPLYQNDSFGPLEENVALSPPKFFLNLSDFGYLENNVFFISKSEDSNFVFAKESIENSDLVKFKKNSNITFI